MMICPKCDGNVTDADTACSKCGEPVYPVDVLVGVPNLMRSRAMAAPAQTEKGKNEYNGLHAAGIFTLAICVANCLYFEWIGLEAFMRSQSGGTEMMLGFGVLAIGITVNGLIGLAINVADDIRAIRQK